MARDVRVAIIGDPSSLQRALRTSETAAASFQTRMASIGQRLSTIGSTLTRNLTLPLIGFGVVAYRELSESQRVLAQTEAVIESTGGAAQRSVGDIENLVTALRDVSGVDDEGIQDMANTLLTFRGIVGDTFDEAARATLDLSVAMDRDLRSSAVMVGRALNDPLRGLQSLTRVGVQFTDEQRAAIEAMVAFGDTAGAQRAILAELNTEFGGSAEAVGSTLQGRLGIVRQQFEDMAASVLEDLLPVLEDLAGVVSDITEGYSELTPEQQKFIAGAGLAALVAGPLASALGGIASAVGLAAKGFGVLGAALGVSAGWAAVIAAGFIAIGVGLVYIWRNWQTVRDIANTFFDLVLGNLPGARRGISALGQAVSFVANALRQAWNNASTMFGWMRQIAGVVFDTVVSAIGRLADGLRGALGAAQSLLSTLLNINSAGSKASGPIIPRAGDGGSSGGAVGGRGRPVQERGGVAELGAAIAREMQRSPQPVYVLNGG